MNIERVSAISLDKNTAEKYAREVISERFSQQANKIKYLGGGSFGSAYGIKFDDGNSIVLKFLRAKDMLNKEVSDLNLLSSKCPIKMPEVLFSRKADEKIPLDCYAMQRIEGKSAFCAWSMFLQSKRKRKAFADQVTSALHQIHCCKNDKFGNTLSPQFTDWTEDYYRPFAQTILQKAEEMYSAGEISQNIINALRAAWNKFDVIFSEKVTEACLIHGDLNIANIMVGKNNKITGIIDPLNSMYADREFDLFQLDNLGGKRFFLRKTYIEKYGASKYCDAKCAFYALYQEVYCYIKSGALLNAIMSPLIKNMYKRLAQL